MQLIRVLVVEDEPGLLDDLTFGLRHEGFEASGVPDGRLIENHLAQSPVDVIVLDLMLPGEDGLSIARRLRVSHPNVGIVMLTGRSSVPDRVVGLESGADIYLTKTVERRELVASIRAVSRRLAGQEQQNPSWVLKHEGMLLLGQNGIEIRLTRQEFLLMRVFSRAYGGDASRKALIEGLGHNYFDFDERRLETLMSRLRRKIEAHANTKGLIRALRAEGYLFTEPLREQ